MCLTFCSNNWTQIKEGSSWWAVIKSTHCCIPGGYPLLAEFFGECISWNICKNFITPQQLIFTLPSARTSTILVGPFSIWARPERILLFCSYVGQPMMFKQLNDWTWLCVIMSKKENFVFYIFVRVSVPQKMRCKVEQSKLALQKSKSSQLKGRDLIH